MLIQAGTQKLPPRTMPKRVTALFNGSKADALAMLRQRSVGEAQVRELMGKVAIQHPMLDRIGESGVEDACIAAGLPLELVMKLRDFRDFGRLPGVEERG